MGFLFSRGDPGKRKGVLVLRLGKGEVDFLFFQAKQSGVQILFHGTEAFSHFTPRQTLEKIFTQFLKREKIHELLATFDASSFQAYVLELQVPPSLSSRVIDKTEARAIEKEVRTRATRIFQNRLFRDTGILPNDFSLRRVTILKRNISGYPVPKLEGFKSGELEFSVLGIFLLERSFIPVEQFAKEHAIRHVRVVHLAEALESFARTCNREGVYVNMEEEKSQIAIWKEGRFAFPESIPIGADHFTEFFSSSFGMPASLSYEFQERYFQGKLSQAAQEKARAMLLPEVRKFGTLIKEKLLEAKMALPDSLWVFGKGRALRNLSTLFSQEQIEDLPFSQNPTMNFLLPRDVWETKHFGGANDSDHTVLCLLGRLATPNA